MAVWSETTSGKWILAGEHSVLRGYPALVLPIESCTLKVSYQSGDQPLSAQFEGDSAKDYQLLFWGVVEEALKKLDRARAELKGELRLESSLPLGSGLGASAALCVSVAKFFVFLGWLKTEEVYEFARSLEDLFHGESSGVDIAVALSGQPIRFLRSGDRQKLILNWKPHWFISPCGERGVTSECVAKVKRMFLTHPQEAAALDLQMANAVDGAERALKLTESEGYSLLVQSIDKAEACFRSWGLVDGALAQHLDQLRSSGAVAAKPTGSGGGGYALSLWQNEPTAAQRQSLGLIQI